MINKFDKKYAFLSNFYETPVFYNGLLYRNAEAAFQAQKTLDTNIRLQFTKYTGAEAKKAGRKLVLRKDWEQVKDFIMFSICLAKFLTVNEVGKLLDQTGDELIVEGNYWHDNYWGDCSCPKCKDIKGQNHLGEIIMYMRSLRKTLHYDSYTGRI